MKILVLTHRTNFSGGANRSLLAVLKGLRKCGHEIDVILPKKVGELNDALTSEGINWKHYQYYRMGAKRYKGIGILLSYCIVYGKLLHHYFVAHKMIMDVKEKDYDVVYVNTILPYAGFFVSQKCKIPVVVHDREPLDGTTVINIKNYVKFIYQHANSIIVISRDLKEQWQRRGYEEKIQLINNGIPLTNAPKASQKVEETFNILMTARIAPMKNHRHALEAVKILKNKGISNIKLYFAGKEGEKRDSEYKEELLAYIQKNDLGNEVIFLGEVSDMGELRKNMHIELMCNPTEPYGRVTVEGMRSGLVVIGVNAGGTLDIINDGENGFLYNKDDVNDLATKIEKVYYDDELRKKISDFAFDYSRTHYTMEENVHSIEKVLQQVVSEKNS